MEMFARCSREGECASTTPAEFHGAGQALSGVLSHEDCSPDPDLKNKNPTQKDKGAILAPFTKLHKALPGETISTNSLDTSFSRARTTTLIRKEARRAATLKRSITETEVDVISDSGEMQIVARLLPIVRDAAAPQATEKGQASIANNCASGAKALVADTPSQDHNKISNVCFVMTLPRTRLKKSCAAKVSYNNCH